MRKLSWVVAGWLCCVGCTSLHEDGRLFGSHESPSEEGAGGAAALGGKAGAGGAPATAWSGQANCGGAPLCTGGACGGGQSCTPGNTVCGGNAVLVCDATGSGYDVS